VTNLKESSIKMTASNSKAAAADKNLKTNNAETRRVREKQIVECIKFYGTFTPFRLEV
jgi:hypothetical protein